MVEEGKYYLANIGLSIKGEPPIDLGFVPHTANMYLNLKVHDERSRKIIPLEPETNDVKKGGRLFGAYHRANAASYLGRPLEGQDVEVLRRAIHGSLPMPETLAELYDYQRDRVGFMEVRQANSGRNFTYPFEKDILAFSLNTLDAKDMGKILNSENMPLRMEELGTTPAEYADLICLKARLANQAFERLTGEPYFDEDRTRKNLDEDLPRLKSSIDAWLNTRMI
ncbi:MAG: hypothetical protein JW727_04170 [Candidatus Aenigmarchaeota archaeon]|nr:hypothetical protein [Candidatus Aenigmarchaeota archaeon]